MTERVNRREEMIEAASELFLKQGYAGTSIQQIADAVGCTKAALYYHFKEGKEEILQEVLHVYLPEMIEIIKSCENATSLRELIIRFGRGMMGHAEHLVHRLRWVISEYPNFNAKEQTMLHNKQIVFHQALTDEVNRFISDHEEAEKISWQIVCSFVGYAQYFISMDLRQVVHFPKEDFLELTANLIACGR